MSRPIPDEQAAPLSATRTEPDHAAQPPAWDWDWDDYLYPLSETGGVEVLRNNLGLRDEDDLRFAERALSAGRQLELAANPGLVPRTFDVAHWQAIHRHLFGEIYPWAGQFRTVDIAKEDGLGNLNSFVSAEDLHPRAADLLDWVRSQSQFAGRPRDGLLAGLAITMQTTNLIHPFREGNGRVQRILAEHIAEQAGHRLDWSQIGSGEQRAMMVMAYLDRPEYLVDALDRALHHASGLRTTPSTIPVPDVDRAPVRWHFAKPNAQVLAEARAQSAGPAVDPSPAAAPDLVPQLGHQAGTQVELGD